jgi:hypothetical protein
MDIKKLIQMIKEYGQAEAMSGMSYNEEKNGIDQATALMRYIDILEYLTGITEEENGQTSRTSGS